MALRLRLLLLLLLLLPLLPLLLMLAAAPVLGVLRVGGPHRPSRTLRCSSAVLCSWGATRLYQASHALKQELDQVCECAIWGESRVYIHIGCMTGGTI